MPKRKGLIINYKELPYIPALKQRSKEMRNNSTKGEIKFWCESLKRKKNVTFYS